MTRLVAFAALALAACGSTLAARSAPPPGRTAALAANDGHYDLDLSQGVAIAITCEHGGPCKDVVVSTEDAAIAEVKGAAFGALEQAPYGLAAATPAGIVIVGKHPGKTRVRVRTAKGSRTIHVTVLPPPALGAPATVARP